MDEAYTEKNKKNPMSVMQIRNSSISDEASSFPESRQLIPDSRANKSITLNKKNSQDIIKKLSKIKTEKIEPREFLNKLKQAFGLNEKENSNYVDLTEEYNKSYSENDIWENINKTAEKENIRTLNNEISIALINTSRKKEHIVFGDGFKNHPQIKRHKIYLMNLEKLINNAKYVGTENNQKPYHKNKKEVILYHYFETTVKIDERFYKVRFGTEELSEKETERYKKIGKLPPSTVSSKMSNLQTIWLSSPNEYSIAHGKNLSSTVPKQNYLYKIGERSLGRDYLNQIQNSQNKSPIKMDVRPMQNQTEENKMQKQNEQTQARKAATNFVLDKLAESGIEVITDKTEMREILNSGKLVQKMAAYHGTSHEGEIDNAFNGFGTYVVSVNTDVAKEQGMKIASKKYGDAFYIKSNGKEQTFDRFLSEHGYSPYWSELLKQTRFDDVAKLQHEIMSTDSKGNAELEGQKTNLSVLLSAGVIEYKREKTYLYSIDIPDNNGKNYLFYEKSIGLDAANTINAALEEMGVEWRVDRRDAGRQVYFNTLSEKVFNGSQEQTSKFLKDSGYAGMEMNSSNYIVFDEKDIVVNKRVQYMMDGNGEVYGFTQNGKIYLDPDLMNSNTPVHEYTHIWDAYTQRTNPELWEKGKAVLQQTHLWQEVVNDPNYAEIAGDEDLVLSEVHSRICGAMAEKVLERIAEQDGEIAKDRAIDWDKETWDYIESELLPTTERSSEFIRNGGSFLNLKEFLATPMQDFMNGRLIGKERNVERAGVETDSPAVNYELDRIQEAGIEVDADKEGFDSRLAWLNEVNITLEMLDEEPIPIQLSENEKGSSLYSASENDTRTRSEPFDKKYTINDEMRQDLLQNLDDFKNSIDTKINGGDFLKHLKTSMNFVGNDSTKYLRQRINGEKIELRISHHCAIAEKSKNWDKSTSVVIKLARGKNAPRFRKSNDAEVIELAYYPENLTKEKEIGIVNGIIDWVKTGEYTYGFEDELHISNRKNFIEKAKGIQMDVRNGESVDSQANRSDDAQPSLNDVARVLGEAGLGVGFQRANENGEWENAQIKFYKDDGESMVIDNIDLSAGGERKAELLKASVENLASFENINPEIKEKLMQASAVLEELFDKNNSFTDVLRESDKSIEEATNGFGHDPTDGFPKDFNPEDERKPMGYYEDGTPFWGDEEENAPPESVDMYTTKDGKLFYPHEIIPNDVSDVLGGVYTGLDTANEKADAYADEICSILEKFSQENSADWNIEAHDKTSVYHLMAVAEIGGVSREESAEKIKEYFATDIYAGEREQLGAMFGKIIETKNQYGYGFDFSTKQKEIEAPEVDEKAQKAAVMKEMLEKMGLKDGKLPEFAMLTQNGLKAYKDMSIAEWNPKDQTFTLAKYEDGVAVEKAVVTTRTLKELVSQPRIEQAQSFDENTPLYDKMLKTQYRDFFERRENSANNFRHNFAVVCRRDLATPTDAIRKASELIKAMPVEERRKTKELLNGLGEKGQSVNEKLVDMYKEALKDVPPNEHYLAQKRALETTRYVPQMFDTVTASGQQVDKGFNLKIGDTINNVSFKVDKIFDAGKEKLLMDCKVVSATKEGNSVTLVDAAGGYHDVPRDTFLKQYAKQQKQEQKQDRHQKNIMRLDIER